MRLALVSVSLVAAVALLCPAPVSAQEIRGQVVDSVTGRPLAGGVVVLLDLADVELARTQTDEEGRFLLYALDVTRYRLRAEAQGYQSSTFPEFEVQPERSVSYILLLPSFATQAAQAAQAAEADPIDAKLAGVCGTSMPGRPTVAGWVRHAGSGEPVTEATISASWANLPDVLARQVSAADFNGLTLADSSGFFAICNVPANTKIMIHAMSAEGVSDFHDVAFGDGAVVADGEAHFINSWVWRQDFAVAPLEDHQTVLRGTVTDGDTGSPVAGSEVELTGTIYGSTTDSAGVFRIEHLPAGPAKLVIRQIGHRPLRQEITLPKDGTLDLPRSMLSLGRAAQMLDPLFVETTASHSPLTEFNRRRKETTGAFLTREEWERQGNPNRTIDVIGRLRGVRITPGPDVSHQYLVSMRRTTSRTVASGVATALASEELLDESVLKKVECPPLVFIDRHYVGNTNTININTQVPVGDLIAAEAHQSSAGMPIEYNRRGSACGVIAFWTRYAQPETVAITDDTRSLFKSTAFHFGAAVTAVVAIFFGMGKGIHF
jgi:hypothetical protein